MKREIPTDLQADDSADPGTSILDTMIEAEETEAVRDAMRKIGEQCRKLLTLYYWDECPMEEIAKRMGFANADTVKSKKYQCKKALEKILNETSNRYV